MFLKTFILVLISALAVSSAKAADRIVMFTPFAADIISPERGFYRGLNSNFLQLTFDELADQRREGVTMVYAAVRLDNYRSRDLTETYLNALDQQFAIIRRTGLKVVLRFTYNYPDNEFDYLNAKDASLAQVRRHIRQLAPLIAKNRHLIAVMQAGFIGAWGEGHTSSSRLDTPANKRAVMSELLAFMPKTLQILWRYPQDLIDWRDAKLPGSSRIGQHNDCFLSSPTDVGTYDDDRELRTLQRKKAAAISTSTYYMGETCAADPAAIRADCASILREGRQFHVSSLNRDYYEAFITSWKQNGCYAEIEKSLGYRLTLVSARLTSDNVFSVTIRNDGWARPVSQRKLKLSWRSSAGTSRISDLGPSSLSELGAGETMSFRARLSPTTRNFCLAAPDVSPVLTSDPRYALRFANANVSSKIQTWDTAKGRFCFKL
jgi:hypothetical protein